LISNAYPLDGSVTKKMTVGTTPMSGIVVTIRGILRQSRDFKLVLTRFFRRVKCLRI
jgi:hypothetical protein